MLPFAASVSALALRLLNLRDNKFPLELAHFRLNLCCMMLSVLSGLGDKPFYFSQSITDPPVIRFYPWQTFWSLPYCFLSCTVFMYSQVTVQIHLV